MHLKCHIWASPGGISSCLLAVVITVHVLLSGPVTLFTHFLIARHLLIGIRVLVVLQPRLLKHDVVNPKAYFVLLSNSQFFSLPSPQENHLKLTYSFHLKM